MGDYRRVGLNDFPPNNQRFNINPFVNIPPPPLPPRFSPLNMPAAPFPPPNSFPPPFGPTYSPYPKPSMLPPVSDRLRYPSSSWDSGVPHSTSTLAKEPSPFIIQLTPNSEDPQNWVDKWVKNKGKLEVVNCDIKIYAVKEKLNAALKLIRELENSSRTLGVMVKSVTTAEWEQKCDEVEEKKRTLISLFNEIKFTETELKFLKQKLSKRTKKRARLRRKSESLKKQKEEEKVKTQNLHFQIDNWQKEMQEGVERVKREEELKKEADAVLWGVTQKKTEAKRQVEMLSALLTLRSVRVARLTATGQPVSQSQIDTFNTVIERLKTMWTQHLEECQKEEQVLRGMLGVHTLPSDTTKDVVKTYKKLVLNEWETAIFGSVGSLDSTLGGDELISIRCAWDRFAVSEPSLLTSQVPPGCVLPVPPSSDLWRSFLKY